MLLGLGYRDTRPKTMIDIAEFSATTLQKVPSAQIDCDENVTIEVLKTALFPDSANNFETSTSPGIKFMTTPKKDFVFSPFLEAKLKVSI